jgi:hypothetical protein
MNSIPKCSHIQWVKLLTFWNIQFTLLFQTEHGHGDIFVHKWTQKCPWKVSAWELLTDLLHLGSSFLHSWDAYNLITLLATKFITLWYYCTHEAPLILRVQTFQPSLEDQPALGSVTFFCCMPLLTIYKHLNLTSITFSKFIVYLYL